jgi:hypothetical protein
MTAKELDRVRFINRAAIAMCPKMFDEYKFSDVRLIIRKSYDYAEFLADERERRGYGEVEQHKPLKYLP